MSISLSVLHSDSIPKKCRARKPSSKRWANRISLEAHDAGSGNGRWLLTRAFLANARTIPISHLFLF